MNNSRKPIPLSLAFKTIRFLTKMVFSFFLRKISGTENLLKDRPFVVASNHTSLMDGLLLTDYLSSPLNRHIHFISKAKYYSNPIFRYLMETAENLKLEDQREARALLVAKECLRHGEIVALFPEGTRSPDGKIRKGKTGVAALALSAKVPVVPVGLIDTDKVLPPHKSFPQPAKCKINIGTPLEFKESYEDYDAALDRNDSAKAKDIEEKVTRTIMCEIARLSNQEYPF